MDREPRLESIERALPARRAGNCCRRLHVSYEPTTLQAETLRLLHLQLEEAYADTEDPVGPGVRDEGILESAAHRPLTALGGTSKYQTPYDAAAALGHSIVNSHPFVDGNKRTALLAMIGMLDREHIGLAATNREAFDFMVSVAKHRLIEGFSEESKPDADVEVEAMASWLRSNSRKTPTGERLLAYRELVEALRQFDVDIVNPKKGNAVDFVRSVDGRHLRTQIGYNGRGNMQVEPRTVRKVRTELQLDEAHGVDHQRFYEAAPPLNALLIEFRGALDALAEYDRSGRPPLEIAERDSRID
jgi:death-on-curing protein